MSLASNRIRQRFNDAKFPRCNFKRRQQILKRPSFTANLSQRSISSHVCSFHVDHSNPRRHFSESISKEKWEKHETVKKENSQEKIGRLELDFFGEPVTFVETSSSDNITNKKFITNAMAALDGFLLAAVSKGLSCSDGGDEGGIEVRSAHAAAVSWAELLRYAVVWNDSNISNKSCPMLAVVAIAPVLVQTGNPYIKHLDTLLKQTKPPAAGLPIIQMYELAKTAAICKDDNHLNPRERMHLQALHYLLENEYPTALAIYVRLLRSCPGDALALSLTMDLCQTLGDKKNALFAAGTVAAYWDERRGGIITPAIPGYSLATSLMALGFAVGGKEEEAEQMADRAMNRGKKVCGALATWAQCHVFDAKGRVAEGISALSNFDGIRNYEGAGFMFFDCRLSGYGARFSLDREERGRGKSAALRLYEDNFERVLGYSGFSEGQPWKQPLQRAPLSWRQDSNKVIESGNSTSSSMWDRILGRKNDKSAAKLNYQLLVQQVNYPSTKLDGWEPSAEDVLTWLPPTPQFLSDATLLCLRFTLNGTISNRNARWDNIRNAWAVTLNMHREHRCDSQKILSISPLVSVVASILFPPHETGGDQIGTGSLATALHLMGELLKLGNPETEEQKQTSIREFVAERSPSFWLPADDEQRKLWEKVVKHFTDAIDCIDNDPGLIDSNEESQLVNNSLQLQCWDFEARPILEHAIVYSACKSGDTESLCLARSICSRGVSIRCNSPEEWWRYSIVLGLLGDDVGSENALNNSINLGGGQGARGTARRGM